MKTMKLSILALLAVFLALPVHAQVGIPLTSTTVTGSITANQNCFLVGSTSGMVSQSNAFTQKGYIMDPGQYKGELVNIVSIPVSGQVCVARLDQFKSQHAAGSLFILGNTQQFVVSFFSTDPFGQCSGTLAQGSITSQVTPWVNVSSGMQWICSTVTNTWVPGFGNNQIPASSNVTTLVPAVAGATTLSGPLFHMSTTNAITSFTLPATFNGGQICIIPDAAFTTVSGNNIGHSSTAVAGQTLCLTYDTNAAKFYTSY